MVFTRTWRFSDYHRPKQIDTLIVQKDFFRAVLRDTYFDRLFSAPRASTDQPRTLRSDLDEASSGFTEHHGEKTPPELCEQGESRER